MELQQAYEKIKKAIENQENIIIVGKCKVKYHGRAASKLAQGERIVIIKEDRSFLVHQNKKLAAINYQPPKGRISTEIKDGALIVRAHRKKPKELLETVFTEIFFINTFKLKDDNDIRIFGTEKNLSELLMQDLELIEPGLKPLKNESPLPKGYIDILAEDKQGNLVVIEIKRRKASLDAVSQLKRYVKEVEKRKDKKTRGIICAPGITQRALNFLEKEGFEFFNLEYEISNPSAKIKGLHKKQKGINEFI